MKVINKTNEVIELIREIAIRATSPYSENRERLNLEDSLLDIRDYIDEILQMENSSVSRRDEYGPERTNDRHTRKNRRPSNLKKRPPRRRTEPRMDVSTRSKEPRFEKTRSMERPRVERHEKPRLPRRKRRRAPEPAPIMQEDERYVNDDFSEENVTEMEN